MSTDVKAVIWDMGGVLLRTENQDPRLRLADRMGMGLQELYMEVFANESAHRAEIGQITAEEHWKNIRIHFNLSASELEEFQNDFWDGDRMDMELIDYIRVLQKRHQTALLSNAWSDARIMLAEKFQVLDAFDLAVFSAEVGLAKPDPRIFRYILDQLLLQPEQTIFVDDLSHNVEAARQLGIHGIVFTSRSQVIDEISSMLY